MHLFLKWLAVYRPNMSPPISFLISNYGRKAFQGSEGGSTYSLLANGCTIGTDYEFLSGGGEIWETFDGEIFMVKVGVVADRLVGLDRTRQSRPLSSGCCYRDGESPSLPQEESKALRCCLCRRQ
jgi:hypothetical protein